MEVIGTTTSRGWVFVFGREKSPNDQYTMVIVMYSSSSFQKLLKGEVVQQIGKYIVETGSLDELSKYKEVGAFSEWPFFRISFSPYSPSQEMNDQDMKCVKWLGKMITENPPKPEMKVEHGSRICRAIHERSEMNDEVSIRSIVFYSIILILFGIAGFTLGCICFWREYITNEMRTLLTPGFIVWLLPIMGGAILMYWGLHDLALLVWRKEAKESK